MLSLRLKTIAGFVKKDATILDVGTDHAYLPIYLKKNNLCKEVYASDISENAIASAKKNIKKYGLNIKLFITNGINNINVPYNTLIISGMGTKTIISILENKTLPKNIILGSNNDLFLLRKYMNNIDYRIIDEKVIKEKNIYYDIISYEKGKEKLSKKYLLYGKSNNKEYYNYLKEKELYIIKKVKHLKKIRHLYNIFILNILINK